MNDAEYGIRKEIIATCLAMDQMGITQGTSGNVSARWEDGLLITPSGLAYNTMAPEEIIYLDMSGRPHGSDTDLRLLEDIRVSRGKAGESWNDRLDVVTLPRRHVDGCYD